MRGHRVAVLLVAAVGTALAGVAALALTGEAHEEARSARVGTAPVTSNRTADPQNQSNLSAPGSRPATVDSDYTFPVAGCRVTYSRAHHDYPAADIFTGDDCTFVAPVDGRVDEVSRTDTWDPSANSGATRGGVSVSLVGVDGVRYYGSHLRAVLLRVRPGLTVRAGQPLGRIGDSGSARGTGTHLHFGISWPTGPGKWWVRRGVVGPQPYLDSWRAGGGRDPAAAVAAARREYGDDSRCHEYC